MTVHTLAQGYQSAGEKSHIKNWINRTVGLRLDSASTNEDGATTALVVTVFTADDTETGETARIESARIIGQVASAGVAVGDILIVAVVPYGKRGQVLAPPPAGDKSADVIAKAFA